MDLRYTESELRFRSEVRDFIANTVPQYIKDKVLKLQPVTKQDSETYHALLNQRGWLGQSWPEEYGGCNWGVVEKHIFIEESAAAGCPRIVPFGVEMLGPVLLKFATEAQRQYFLPRILDGSHWWCQGYSEPGAGSDLASLKTQAVRSGQSYLVNGQKTWTTYGHHANWIFCLVRTQSEGKPQQGISFLLIDMQSPGIDVRPIKLLDGTAEVNEVFFDNVEVPVENLIGEENHGWTYAKYLLTHERTGIAGVGFATHYMQHLKMIAGSELKNGRPLLEDPLFAARVATVEIDLEAMKTTNLRVVAAVKAGAPTAASSSMLKVKGTLIRQEIDNLMRQALGPMALPFIQSYFDPVQNTVADPEAQIADSHPVTAVQPNTQSDASLSIPEYAPPVASRYFNQRKLSIYGGSNEIQRGIIAKLLLGL